MHILNVLNLIRDYLDMTMILSGVVFLIIGLLYKRDMGSWVSAATLFLGVLFFTFGVFMKLGVFSVKRRSMAGIGIMLICASVIGITISVVLFQFVDMSLVGFMPTRTRIALRQGLDYRVTCILWEHRYLWLSIPLGQVSLALLLCGVTLRIFSLVFPLADIKFFNNKRQAKIC